MVITDMIITSSKGPPWLVHGIMGINTKGNTIATAINMVKKSLSIFFYSKNADTKTLIAMVP